jgi:patatin-like phospholipase
MGLITIRPLMSAEWSNGAGESEMPYDEKRTSAWMRRWIAIGRNVRRFAQMARGLQVGQACVCLTLLALIGACAPSSKIGNRVPEALVNQASVDNFADIRFWGDGSESEYTSLFTAHWIAKLRKGHKVNIETLSLSGGGEDGAFGAGLLVGWSESGTRPEFEVVYGISTGAMIAPLAFLGPRYDAQLKKAYTTVTVDQSVRPQVLPAIFGTAAGLFDPKPLAKMIARFTSQQMLKEIASEYRKGRFLLIGTTNLDAQRPVIWNIGAIANSGKPGALELVRKILLASASVPGVFPPVKIDVTAANKSFHELHVDGGVTHQVFLYPPGFEPANVDRAVGWRTVKRAYIIRNAKVAPEFALTEAKLTPIGSRAISTLIKTQGIGDLYEMYMTTQRDNVDYNLAYIPADFHYPSKSPFDPAYMKALFNLGYTKGRAGYRWHKVPPGWE